MKILYPAQFEEIKSNDVWYDDDGGETYMEFNDGFVVTFRDIPDANTCGDTFLDAAKMAQECLCLVIEGRIEDGLSIPTPSEPEHGDIIIEVEV